MRKDFQIALLLAVASLPAGLAMSIAIEYFPFLKQHPGIGFWASFGVTVLLLALAGVIAIRGEQAAERSGAKKRMIPFVGMVVSGVFFVVFAAWYFWPVTILDHIEDTEKAAPANNKVATVKNPDVTLRFVYPEQPQIMLINTSDVVAQYIKWTVLLWNLDNPMAYSQIEHAKDDHEPLPIPISIFDFLRARSQGIQGLFTLPTVSPHVKNGNRLVGSASVECPTCERGRTFLVYIVYGVGGWYSELPAETSGSLVIPKQLKRDDVIRYYDEIIAKVPESLRMPIRAPY
jgi:hypothetical protein